MGRTSARDRLEHLRLEAELKAKEKEAAKAARDAAKATGAPAPRRKAAAAGDGRSRGRVRIVWNVCDAGGKEVQSFPYAQEQEAKAAAAELTTSTGRTHFVTKGEVPFG